jgi:hypothetical protein
LNQSGSASASTTGAARCSARARPGGARTEASYTSTGSSLHDTGIYAAEESTCLGAEDVSVGDGDVIAGNRQVEIIFEGEIDCILQRKIEFALANELRQAR